VPGIGDITSSIAGKCPIVVTYHAGSMRKGSVVPDLFIWLYEHGPLSLLLHRASRIICSSNFVRLEFLHRYKHKSMTITPGVDNEIFKPDEKRKSRNPNVLFIGGLSRAEQHKGLDVLIEAIQKIRKALPDVHLTIVGDGDMKNQYEAHVARLGLQESVTFMGKLTGDPLVKAYQQAWVLVQPSFNESFSMVILEAMACKKPVIATEVGGIPEAIINNEDGILIPPGNASLLTEAMERLLKNSDAAASIGERGFKKIIEKFTWTKKTNETNEVFQQILHKETSVLIICKEYPPHVLGGLGVHYHELIHELKKYCTVNLICAREDDQAPKEEHLEGLTIYRIRIPKIFPLNHIAFNVLAFFKSLGIKKDVVHLCSPFGVLNILIKTTPTVAKIHTVYAAQKGKYLYDKIYFPLASLIDRLIISRSDQVMTTSNFMKDDICQKYGTDPSKISVIYNGINQEHFKQAYDRTALRKRLNVPLNAKVVLYVGRFVERKGALKLIQAMPQVIKQEPDSLFILIGGGFTEGSAYEQSIHSLIETLKLQDNIRILPWIPHDEVINYYKVADIFIHPAIYEPFGNNIVEAMAAGLPVISIKSGGPEEIIGTNGILLKDNSPALIEKSLTELLGNQEERRRFSILAKKRAEDFSWDTVARETLKVYREIQ
jgi:glycosyltransferase involved in cell wall biosynthesis